VSCRALGVSQAWFFKWRKGDRSPRRKRRTALAATIAYLFTRHNGTYGPPRITADLRALGWRVSPNTVAALMAAQGLVARRKRKRRGTTRPDKSARKAPDGLRRDFTPPQRPDVRWCGDLTEIPTDEGKLQLAAVSWPGCCFTPIMPRLALSRGFVEMACAGGGCSRIPRLNVSGCG
jgi:putative transposase